jgi:hypothetical protein
MCLNGNQEGVLIVKEEKIYIVVYLSLCHKFYGVHIHLEINYGLYKESDFNIH